MSMKRTCSIGLAILLMIAGSASALTVTTAKGNGADTALENDGQSGNHGPTSLHGAEGSLAVRRYDGTRQKMIYLRFDITGAAGDLTKATLTFNVTGGALRARVWGVNGPAALPTGWHHVAVVIDSATMRLQLYQDGALVASGATTVLPKDLGATSQNWLGRSQWTADAFFGGSIDDFRIYNRALSESEVRYLAGDR